MQQVMIDIIHTGLEE